MFDFNWSARLFFNLSCDLGMFFLRDSGIFSFRFCLFWFDL